MTLSFDSNRCTTFPVSRSYNNTGWCQPPYTKLLLYSKSLVYGGWHQPVLLYDLETGKVVQRFESNDNVIFAVAIRPGGKEIITAHRDSSDGPGTLRFWDIKTG